MDIKISLLGGDGLSRGVLGHQSVKCSKAGEETFKPYILPIPKGQ